MTTRSFCAAARAKSASVIRRLSTRSRVARAGRTHAIGGAGFSLLRGLQSPPHERPQGLHPSFSAREHLLRKPATREDRRVDLRRIIAIQSQSRQVLHTQIAVAIDGRTFEPLLEVGLLPCVV